MEYLQTLAKLRQPIEDLPLPIENEELKDRLNTACELIEAMAIEKTLLHQEAAKYQRYYKRGVDVMRQYVMRSVGNVK